MKATFQRPRHPTGITSPFADVEAAVPRAGRGRGSRPRWVALVVLLIAVGLAAAAVLNHLKDPYRTLEPFPISKYLDNYRSMAGSRFKALLRVEADLGWKEGVGRLMLFSLADEPRPIAVMVPESIGKPIYFTKGQTYQTEMEVKEGGLIYVNACRKN